MAIYGNQYKWRLHCLPVPINNSACNGIPQIVGMLLQAVSFVPGNQEVEPV
ncbi:hypothetical protein [Parabacteroides bouchesdurhonensis]|uniref:hypothetical protein n=1 Tax=Parabacteroides bouchesdurhonensis TaxID=1936995 RepID=UPI00131CC848|nr:hypothetical protein [Parabacteroides bouchesdurhonensis]